MPDAHYHRCLRALIGSLNGTFLAENDCFLSGATPVILELGEYRSAAGLVLSCVGQTGYRKIREAVSQTSLGPIFIHPIELARPGRTDRFGIRTYVMIESTPIHFEIYKEDRFQPNLDCCTGAVPTLSKSDMFVERLLANTDQHASSIKIKPAIVDLAMMVANWGAIPNEAWNRAKRAYGDSVTEAYAVAVSLLNDADNRSRNLCDLSLEPHAHQVLLSVLPELLVNSRWGREATTPSKN